MLTSKELTGIAGSFGDTAYTAAGWEVHGRYQAPQVEERLVEGTAPQFTTASHLLAQAGLARGSRIESIRTYHGELAGPFKVVGVRAITDGAFTELALQRVS